ncbi:MAG: GDP-mannose 4,6-dehydratase, partial [Acidobacteria bacterium]|nr:GDP-mannose 4,6-dehydratase [Acidobacteriota bacterium]
AEDAEIGPVSPYGLSKLAQEMLAARYAADGLGVIRTRSFTHIGPGQNPSYAASSFARQIARIEAGRAEPVLRVGDLDARRDLLDVRDTVRAYRGLMEQGTSGAVYNVCSGAAHPMREVLERLVSLTGIPIEVRVDPARLRPSDYPVLCGDRSRITADVGWAPRIPLSETLRDLLDHWRAAVG